jgi:hypothetical protein
MLRDLLNPFNIDTSMVFYQLSTSAQVLIFYICFVICWILSTSIHRWSFINCQHRHKCLFFIYASWSVESCQHRYIDGLLSTVNIGTSAYFLYMLRDLLKILSTSIHRWSLINCQHRHKCLTKVKNTSKNSTEIPAVYSFLHWLIAIATITEKRTCSRRQQSGRRIMYCMYCFHVWYLYS